LIALNRDAASPVHHGRTMVKHLLPLLFAVGCAETPRHEPTPTSGPTLAQDTFYTGVSPEYATPEDCVAQSPMPIDCHLEIALCAGGVAGFSNFDLPQQGMYYLDGSTAIIAVNNETENEVIQLDTQTGAASADAQTETYIVDTVDRWQTLQFDPGVICPDNPNT